MDDIVTRLQVIHCAADDLTSCGTCLPCRAAEEIERLRQEIDIKGSRLDDALDEIERLRQGIWDACRILGMDTDGDPTPHAHAWPHLADLIAQEAMRSTSQTQEEVERLQAIEDLNAAYIERLRTENAAMRRQALQNMIDHSENANLYQQP